MHKQLKFYSFEVKWAKTNFQCKFCVIKCEKCLLDEIQKYITA